MPKMKLSIDFSAFAEMAEKLDELGGDLKGAAQEALEVSKDHVNASLHRDMKRHHRTGRTEMSIMDHAKVEWSGNIAEIEVGFNVAHYGLPSIFLMYGTPKMLPDRRLYNDVYGASTKRKIRQLQEEVFRKAIEKRMGGQ